VSGADKWLANEVAAAEPEERAEVEAAMSKTAIYQWLVFGDALRQLGAAIRAKASTFGL
jgi:hypothetical protein